MLWVIVIALFILVVAPARQVFFGAWRFTLPAVMGFVFAIIMLRSVMKANLPGFEVLGLAAFVAMVAGVEGLKIFNDTFGSNKKQ